jgi:tetratricopeptide (TPR) repeat protein
MRIWNTAEQDRPERLRLASERALAWHRRGALVARNDRNQRGRVLHLRYLIEAEPTDILHRENLASALAYLGQWEQALAENDKAIELGSRNLRLGTIGPFYVAVAAIKPRIGRLARKLRRRSLTDNPDLANGLA